MTGPNILQPMLAMIVLTARLVYRHAPTLILIPLSSCESKPPATSLKEDGSSISQHHQRQKAQRESSRPPYKG